MGQLNLSVVEIDRILGSGLKTFEKPLLQLQAKELFFVPSQQPSLFCAKFCLSSSFLFFLFRIRVCLCHEAKKKKEKEKKERPDDCSDFRSISSIFASK